MYPRSISYIIPIYIRESLFLCTCVISYGYDGQAQAEQDGESVRQTKRPRAIILVPTRELAVQVLEVAKRLSRTCKFSSCGVVGGEDYGKQRQRLAGTVDIVVATPGNNCCVHKKKVYSVERYTSEV